MAALFVWRSRIFSGPPFEHATFSNGFFLESVANHNSSQRDIFVETKLQSARDDQLTGFCGSATAARKT
jgi:hypothetical protein